MFVYVVHNFLKEYEYIVKHEKLLVLMKFKTKRKIIKTTIINLRIKSNFWHAIFAFWKSCFLLKTKPQEKKNKTTYY